jgi:hypothetical protein
MIEIFSHLGDIRNEISIKQANAIDAIRTYHDPYDRATMLSEIYSNALVK